MKIEEVPTRAQHEREAQDLLAHVRARLPWANVVDEQQFVAYMVNEDARSRHAARVAACWDRCKEVARQYWPDLADPATPLTAVNLTAQAVAILALLGQGGPKDLGGPQAKSRLPLVDNDVFRWQSGPGKAWVEALKEVASRARLVIRVGGDVARIVVESPDGELTIWNSVTGHELDLQVRSALWRAVLGEGAYVTDETAPIQWEGIPEDVGVHAIRVALAMTICPE